MLALLKKGAAMANPLQDQIDALADEAARLRRELRVERTMVDLLLSNAAANGWKIRSAIEDMHKMVTANVADNPDAEAQRLTYVARLESLLSADETKPPKVTLN